MPTTNIHVISDDMFQKYKESVAQTETLIAAVRASRERAERFSNNSRISGHSSKKHKVASNASKMFKLGSR